MNYGNTENKIVSDEIVFGKNIAKASVTDFEGNIISECDFAENKISLSLNPFEIKTLAIEF